MLVSAIGYLSNNSALIREIEYSNAPSRIIDSQGFGTFSEVNNHRESNSFINYLKSLFNMNKSVNSAKLDKIV